MNTLTASELRHGDVLLFHGNGFLSRFIRFFDGSEYSHAAIFDGENVVEAEPEQGDAIRIVPPAIAGASAAYTHVYRFTSDDRQQIDHDLPYEPIAQQIAYFKQTPEAYAYSQILLLGLLLATRHLPIPSAAPLLRHFLDEAAAQLNTLINAGRKIIICSELVYKCFADTGLPLYQIDIAGVDSTAVPRGLESRATLMPSTTAETDAAHLRKDAAAFLSSYCIAKPGLPQAIAGTPPDEPIAVAEFVTPRDLATSPNLAFVGQLLSAR